MAACGQDRSNPSAEAEATASSASSSHSPDSSHSPASAPAASAPASSPERTDRGRSSAPASAPEEAAAQVLVLGNSIAAGYGLPSPQTQSFPARLQQTVDSLGWDARIQNAGLSGETTAGGLRRIGWLLQNRNAVDVLVLELGGNDGLRGVDLSTTRSNLEAIIDTTLSHSPDAHVLLASVPLPPNLGPEYTQQFQALYPDIAAQYDRVTHTPLVPQGLGSVGSYMQNDGIHPNVAGHRYVAKNVWAELRPLLARIQQERATAEPSAAASPSAASLQRKSSLQRK